MDFCCFLLKLLGVQYWTFLDKQALHFQLAFWRCTKWSMTDKILRYNPYQMPCFFLKWDQWFEVISDVFTMDFRS